MKKLALVRNCILLACSLLTVSTALAKGSELHFESGVVSVSETDNVVVILVQGIEVPVNVDSQTEVEDGDDNIALADLQVDDFVKVEAFFESGAIVAEEIKLLERENEEFRLRGKVEAVTFSGSPTATVSGEAATVTLLGVDVIVDDATRINARGRINGRGWGNRVPIAELAVGDEIDVRGYYDGSWLLAERLKIGERASGKIEVEGEFVGYTDEGFLIEMREAGELLVITDELTELKGELAQGSNVKVEGILTETLAVLASEVKVDGSDGQNGRGNGKGNGKDNGNSKGNGNNGNGNGNGKGKGKGNS